MERTNATHDARCLVILAGEVLERSIEDRARRIAKNRGSVQIEPDDVRDAATQVLREELSQLPHVIKQEFNDYTSRKQNAA